MRYLAKLKATRRLRTGIALPVKLGLGIFLLVLAGPALGGREAPAVWVPLAPAGMEIPTLGGYAGAKRPIVLVPYRDTLQVPDSGQPLVPWTPEYLSAPGPGLADGAARSGLPSGDLRRAGPLNGHASGPSFTLSDVLRDVDWRRQTAKRLRQDPAFKPRF